MDIYINTAEVDWGAIEEEVDYGLAYFSEMINEGELTLEEAILATGKLAEALACALNPIGSIQ